MLLEALGVRSSAVKVSPAPFGCRVLPFSRVNADLCTNPKSKSELAAALSVASRRASVKDFHLGTSLVLMSHTCNQVLLFSSY